MTKARDLASGGFGLVLIKPSTVVNGTDNGKGTVSFTGQSTVSLNGCFNSTYDNYKIVFEADSSSGTGDIKIRFRTSGADNTSNVYYSARQFNFAYNTSYFGDSVNPSTISTPITGFDFNTRGCQAVLEVSGPNKAKGTFVKNLGNYGYVNLHSNITHDSATQFDGISFILGTGTMTGQVSVYGYNK